MTPHWLLWGGLVGLVTLAALLTVWSRRDTLARPLAVALALVAPFLAVATIVETMGRHKPSWAAWELRGPHRVLRAELVQDVGIFLYVRIRGQLEPRAVRLPWDNESARQIQGLSDDSWEQGNRGEFVAEFEMSWNTKLPKFRALPEPKALPDKPVPVVPPSFGI